MSLSQFYQELARQLNFAEDVLLMLQECLQTELQKITLEKSIPENEQGEFYLNKQTFSGQIIPQQKIPQYQGYVTKLIIEGVFTILNLSELRELVSDLQVQLIAKGYLLFSTDYNYADNQGKVILIKSHNPYDILTIQLTNGANYNISNRDIVERLQQWSNICSFQIIGADFDWIDLHFQTLPQDLNSFTEEIYQFCPDILDQGYVGEPLSEDADLEDWEDALDEQTIEDLAESLQKTKNLLLWWD